MSTVKISELPVLSSADAADEFVVVDDSAGVTKKITFDSLATDVRSELEPLTASTVTASTVTASTVTASGLVTAGGINFGADTLDDYEEGTWNDSLSFEFSNIGISSFNTSRTFAQYYKVGPVVTIFGHIEFSGDFKDAGDHVRLSGLPFVAKELSFNKNPFIGSLHNGRSIIDDKNAFGHAIAIENTNQLHLVLTDEPAGLPTSEDFAIGFTLSYIVN